MTYRCLVCSGMITNVRSSYEDREIEPYYLIFKWSSWYVWGWCKAREDFRLFKLNRMDELEKLSGKYLPRSVPLPDLSSKKIFPGGRKVKAVFQPEMSWRLVEEFGRDCFEPQPDGTLLFQWEYSDKENLINWILTFGNQVEVLEPGEIRQELLKTANSVIKIYQEQGKDR